MSFQASRADPQERSSTSQEGPWGETDHGVAEAPEPVTTGKWSPRLTLLFIVITCGLFWAVVALATLRRADHGHPDPARHDGT